MRKLEIYEPPLCCPTGVCGPAPDPPGEAPGGHPPVEEGGVVVEAARNQPGTAAVHVEPDGGRLLDPGRAGGPSGALLDGKVVCKGNTRRTTRSHGRDVDMLRMPTCAAVAAVRSRSGCPYGRKPSGSPAVRYAAARRSSSSFSASPSGKRGRATRPGGDAPRPRGRCG